MYTVYSKITIEKHELRQPHNDKISAIKINALRFSWLMDGIYIICHTNFGDIIFHKTKPLKKFNLFTAQVTGTPVT